MSAAAMRGVKVAVFDLDGTLFDSTELWKNIDVEFLKKRGYAPTEEYLKGIAALGNREVAAFTVKHYALPDTPEELIEEWMRMAYDAYRRDIKLFDGAAEYLKRLKRLGVRIVAATSLAGKLARAGLESNGISGEIERLFVSDDMNLSKSSPEFYAHIAKELGVLPERCVVFDDVSLALKSAKQAGMRAVAVCHEKSYLGGAEKSADCVLRSFFTAPDLLVD